MHIKKIILNTCCLLTTAFSVSARDTSVFNCTVHQIEFNLRPSYIMPTHPFFKGHNAEGKPMHLGGSAHLQYSSIFAPESRFGRAFPTAYQGIGIGGYSFFNQEEVGTPISTYIFQGGTLARFTPGFSVGYEWNLGISFGWHSNSAIKSRINAYINVGLPFTCRISPSLALTFGPDYTHFSNGDTTFPNGGANTLGLRLGLRGEIRNRNHDKKSHILESPESEYRNVRFRDRIEYDLTAFGAWRADRDIIDGTLYIINKPFAIAGVHFNPMYRIDRHFSAGMSLDLNYDGSANLRDHIVDKENRQVISYSVPPIDEQISAGLSIRGELTMPIFAVNIGAGYNLYKTGKDMKLFYTVFNLKTFVSENMFLLIGYRLSSLQYTHNLMFGLGWRFRKKS